MTLLLVFYILFALLLVFQCMLLAVIKQLANKCKEQKQQIKELESISKKQFLPYLRKV